MPDLSGPFVLKSDVVLIPRAEVSDDARSNIALDDGDVALFRRHGRTMSHVVDGETASLLALFREPRTIAGAVIDNSRALGADAAGRLDELLPHLQALVETEVLVPADAADDAEPRPAFPSGTRVGGWKIVRCTSAGGRIETYQLHDGERVAALRSGPEARLHREAAILRRLDGSGIAPRLLDAGVHDGRPFLITEWPRGIDAATLAARNGLDRARLRDLRAPIESAYAALHARGVVHGDVDPRAMFVDGDHVTLLGFGDGRDADAASAARERRDVGALLHVLESGNTVLQSLAVSDLSHPVVCAAAATGVLQLAATQPDETLLAFADLLSARASARVGHADAFGTAWHVHAVAATVAAANGDATRQRQAIASFIEAANEPTEQLGILVGRAGILRAAAMLLPLDADAAALRACGNGMMKALWAKLEERLPLGVAPTGEYLGMAHGWAGYFYATARWCAASGDPLPPSFLRRLREYVPLHERSGRGIFWPRHLGGPADDMLTGWCHGSSGQLLLFTLVHRLLGGREWLDLAERCAWDAYDEPRNSPTLCCGTAGRAYALLNFYRHTGENAWLTRARELAAHAAASSAAAADGPNPLLKGELGIAVLVADLSSPHAARMPFFE